MMHSYQSFAVIGGDLRQAHVANQLAAQGKTVYALLLETNEALHRTLICEKHLVKFFHYAMLLYFHCR